MFRAKIRFFTKFLFILGIYPLFYSTSCIIVVVTDVYIIIILLNGDITVLLLRTREMFFTFSYTFPLRELPFRRRTCCARVYNYYKVILWIRITILNMICALCTLAEADESKYAARKEKKTEYYNIISW